MTPYLLCLIGGIALGVAALAFWPRRQPAETPDRQPSPADLNLLTAGLAHEIKNPLSTLQLNLQLLGEDLADQSLASRDPAPAGGGRQDGPAARLRA